MPITILNGVGIKVAEWLSKINVHSVADLLFHLPHHYQDRARLYAIADVKEGMRVSVQGKVVSCHVQFINRRILRCKISDGSGNVTLNFFHFNASQQEAFKQGILVNCFGEFRRSYQGLEVTHPDYSILQENKTIPIEERLTPIYPATEGLKQSRLLNLTEQALEHLQQNKIEELLPGHILDLQFSLYDALLYLHRPPADACIEQLANKKHPAQQRLIIEELVAQQISMMELKLAQQANKSFVMQPNGKLTEKLLSGLHFTLTNAQKRVSEEVLCDLKKSRPMMRLIQGDVGSGKTLIAALAALAVIESGFQVALMVPTELLAEQHGINFGKWFEPLNIQTGILTGKLKVKEKRSQIENIQSGLTKMLVGTHALISQNVTFKNLALIIVDEQHRFGVEQRLSLLEKGKQQDMYPHQLIITATPIPRTLSMTAYADLNVSVIDELPPGRTKIKTIALPDLRRVNIIERVHQACKNDRRQAYWVCTLIDDSQTLSCQAAEDIANTLKLSLPDLRIGLVHGRMKASEKQNVMDAFKAQDLDLLVATTVIEVGVDVPNASLMIIENPERLGLAQLHQLRGRVGRGNVASHCVLLYKAPLSQSSKHRINILRKSCDGFYLAEQDLLIRGSGEVLGTKQTGIAAFKIADLLRDQDLIPQAQRIANDIMRHHVALIPKLNKRWIGKKSQYGHA